MWILTADLLVGCLTGGSNEKAVPEVPPVLMLLHELSKMAALPRAMEARRRSGLFIEISSLRLSGLFTILLRVQLRNSEGGREWPAKGAFSEGLTRWIEEIETWFNGGLMVKLKGGEKVEVSRRQATKFKDLMSL